ncbi:MAG: 4Fe-4S cluster-binding domain-containing protein [Candidatus Nanoarchaeia archaeon]|nr:4Fe-4S cluster-binding domain-containing protein [Candidatus Nanoarchaeia archaeon]
MQQTVLKLKEIVYELLGKCDHYCVFCGSKEVWDEKIDEEKIKNIVDKIVKYPPEQIDISGGNPLLVSRETHQYLVKKLKEKNVIVKILTSVKDINRDDYYDIVDLYNHIGLSVNQEEDIELVNDVINKKITSKTIWELKNKITIITNFNLSNIFLFEKIKKIVKEMDCLWMVQYTIYRDLNNPLAIYNNDGSVEFLKKSIQDADIEGIKILISDNMSGNICTAGSNSLGILSNGDIVPCLSMRSWLEIINHVIVGNVISEKDNWRVNSGYDQYEKNPLKYIWEKRFDDYRFKEFKCCKDHCRNKTIGTYCLKKDLSDDIKKEIKKSKTIQPMSPYTPLLYGVSAPLQPVPKSPEGVFVYAVPSLEHPIVTFYGVSFDKEHNIKINYETTCNDNDKPNKKDKN